MLSNIFDMMRQKHTHIPICICGETAAVCTLAYSLLLYRLGGSWRGGCIVYNAICVGMLCADKYLGHRLAVVSRRDQKGPNRWPRSFRPRH